MDNEMSYEELTQLIKKQDCYIKELERKLHSGTISSDECGMIERPTTEKLERELENQSHLINKQHTMIDALMESLRVLHTHYIEESGRADYYKARYLELKDKGENK